MLWRVDCCTAGFTLRELIQDAYTDLSAYPDNTVSVQKADHPTRFKENG